MLLLGVDARARWAADDVRSDTIIILHIPASHDQAYLISIPRDTEAQIPAFEKSGTRAAPTRSSGVLRRPERRRLGGRRPVDGQDDQVVTGISFDGAAIIDFGGFKSVIDALGTVRICVSQEVKSHHMSYVDGKPMWNADAKKTGKS